MWSISNIRGSVICQEQALGLERLYGLGDFLNIGLSGWIAFSKRGARIGHRFPFLLRLSKRDELAPISAHGSGDIGADGPAGVCAERDSDIGQTNASEVVPV